MKNKDRYEIIRDYTGEVTGTGMRAIRTYCVKWCMNNSPVEVRECTSKDCALWPFRFGSSPYTKRPQQTVQQKDAARERLSQYRLKGKREKTLETCADGLIGKEISRETSEE